MPPRRLRPAQGWWGAAVFLRSSRFAAFLPPSRNTPQTAPMLGPTLVSLMKHSSFPGDRSGGSLAHTHERKGERVSGWVDSRRSGVYS